MRKAQLSIALQPLLAKDALLVSDGNPTYHYFAQDAAISHDAINLSAGVRVKGAGYIQNVNAYHGHLEQWFHRFHGVGTNYLDNYLGLALGRFPHLTVT